MHEIAPDIALLQEVTALPDWVHQAYSVQMRPAAWKQLGTSLKVQTAILVRGTIGPSIPLVTPFDWVNRELEHFKGNVLAFQCNCLGHPLRLLSVYSPAWAVARERLEGIDVSAVKLKLNRKVWVADLLWSALQHTVDSEPAWVIAGDFNASETFDIPRPRGNRELLDRMAELGLVECLRDTAGELVPTYRHTSGQIRHQMDHLFVSSSLRPSLKACRVGDQPRVFAGLSDHLPIIADFGLPPAL